MHGLQSFKLKMLLLLIAFDENNTFVISPILMYHSSMYLLPCTEGAELLYRGHNLTESRSRHFLFVSPEGQIKKTNPKLSQCVLSHFTSVLPKLLRKKLFSLKSSQNHLIGPNVHFDELFCIL